MPELGGGPAVADLGGIQESGEVGHAAECSGSTRRHHPKTGARTLLLSVVKKTKLLL